MSCGWGGLSLRHYWGEGASSQEGWGKGGRDANVLGGVSGYWSIVVQGLEVLCRACNARGVLRGGVFLGATNCNQKVVVSARGGVLQLICMPLSLQMEACL